MAFRSSRSVFQPFRGLPFNAVSFICFPPDFPLQNFTVYIIHRNLKKERFCYPHHEYRRRLHQNIRQIVDQFLTREGESVEAAKARLKQEQADRETASRAAAEERAAKIQAQTHKR
jgi:hypothetical protein